MNYAAELRLTVSTCQSAEGIVFVDEGEDQGTVDSVFGVDCALVFTFIHDYRLQTLDGFDA